MGNAVLIPENLMATTGAVAVASSEASVSMADDNLLTESPSKFWRSTTNAPSHTALYFKLNSRAMSLDTVALLGHRLRRGDQYRIFINNASGSVFNPNGYVGLNPTSTIASTTTNTTSTFADCDNGEVTPGATFATPTSGSSPWTIGVGFDTPASAPVSGADMQAFWVYVKSTTPDADHNPVVSCAVYESGVLKSTLATRTIRSSTGQWLCFPWNASVLATASGANVECVVSFTGLGTSSASSLGSIVWAADLNARISDSGWITYVPFIGNGITYRPEIDGGGNAIIYQFPSNVAPIWVHVHIRSSQSPTDYSELSETLPSPDGYVQLGCVVIGERWSPTVNMSYGKLVAGIDTSPKKRTYGGQLFGSRRPVRRVVSLQLGHLTPSECHTIFDRLIWRHGVMRPFLISLLPDDTAQSKHTTIFGALRNPENWVNIQPEEGYENNMSLEFEEVL